ncbi:MAG: pilin [Patescibacteria group bacterium]
MPKLKTGLFLISLLALTQFALSAPVFAETICGVNPNDPLGLDCAAATGLTAQDPRIVASKIINVVLGLLGIIATVLIFYAGFLWMTSAGEEEKAEKARNIIYGAVIGLIIILSAFTISAFVINNLTDVTQVT